MSGQAVSLRKAALCKGIRAGCAGLALAILAGCSSGGVEAGYWAQVFQAGRQSVELRRAPPPQAPPLTRALLAGFDQPLVRITNLSAGTSATLIPVTDRGRGASRVVTWRGVSPVTFTTRGGLLAATRGTGPDLMSSDLRGLARALASGGGRYSRSHVVLLGNTEGQTLAFDCTLRAVGAETVTIVERSFATTRFVEDCAGPAGTFRNDYWRAAGSGILWQSRQWAGPQLGHLLLEQVIN